MNTNHPKSKMTGKRQLAAIRSVFLPAAPADELPKDRAASPAHCRSQWLFFWLLLPWLFAQSVCAELVLTNYSTANPLKVMAAGDSITDDSPVNGAWRQYLQPLLETNGYPFTFVGRSSSVASQTFTKTRHEGFCGAVIASPGVYGSVHGYSSSDNYTQKTLMDALANATPDLFLINMGVNDIGRGRTPQQATDALSTLLNSIFAKVPGANIIVTKPTTITYDTFYTPYSVYAGGIPTYCALVQAMVNTRRANGQNVFLADLFSVVDGKTMLRPDCLHPNLDGLTAIAKEWMFRIDAITVRTNRAVTTLIAGGSVWKYSDQGLDLGTSWSQPQFDDSAWSQGPARLGYSTSGIVTAVSHGPISTNKYITTYFRRSFVVPSNVHYTNLNFRLNRADGAVVWLNGSEVFRVNLTNQSLSSKDLSTIAVAGDSLNTYYPTNIPVSSLPAGINVVAVEIHKSSPSRSTLSFDLELFGAGYYQPPAPLLSVSPKGANPPTTPVLF